MIYKQPEVCSKCGKGAHGKCNNSPSYLHCEEGLHPLLRAMLDSSLSKKYKVLVKVSFKPSIKQGGEALERKSKTNGIFFSCFEKYKP